MPRDAVTSGDKLRAYRRALGRLEPPHDANIAALIGQAEEAVGLSREEALSLVGDVAVYIAKANQPPPPPPDDLSPDAKAEWERMSHKLYAARLLSTVNPVDLAAYCEAWAECVAAERALQG